MADQGIRVINFLPVVCVCVCVCVRARCAWPATVMGRPKPWRYMDSSTKPRQVPDTVEPTAGDGCSQFPLGVGGFRPGSVTLADIRTALF